MKIAWSPRFLSAVFFLGLVVLRADAGPTTNALSRSVHATLRAPGEVHSYRFALESRGWFYFDARTYVNPLHWSLQGPKGQEVEDRSFAFSDANGVTDSLLRLERGDYQLSVRAVGDWTGDYEFVLSDLRSARLITPNLDIGSKLSPGNASDIYQFAGTAGDLLHFKTLGSTNAPVLFWRVVDPTGNFIVNNGFSDRPPLTLGQDGTYYLLVEGGIANSGIASYGFRIESQGHQTPPPFTGIPSGFGTNLSGTFVASGESKDFLIAIDRETIALVDSLTDNNRTLWNLQVPGRALTQPLGLGSSDGDRLANPALFLSPGTYQIHVTAQNANAGAFSFRLLDLASALPTQLDATNSNVHTQSRSTYLYSFTGHAGDRIFVDSLGYSGFAQQPYWRVLGPVGQELVRNYFNTDLGPIELPEDGNYYLSVEAQPYDNSAGGQHRFVIRNAQDLTGTIQLGSLVNVTLKPGQRATYNLSIPSIKTVYFDSLSDENRANWSLIGPQGTLVNQRSFDVSDGGRITPSGLLLPPAEYQIVVDGQGDFAGSVAFRFLDEDAATGVQLDQVVTGSLAPANSMLLYQFSVTQPTTVLFDLLSSAGFGNRPNLVLVDPSGTELLRQPFDDSSRLRLPAAGTYQIVIDGRVGEKGASGDFSFVVRNSKDQEIALNLNQTVRGHLNIGQQIVYSITANQDSLWYLDSFSSVLKISWLLRGPTGTLVQRRSIAYDASNLNPAVLAIPPGLYELVIDGDQDYSGDYAFRLLDLPTYAQPITFDTSINGTNNSANGTRVYSFAAASGDQFFFDRMSLTGFNSSVWWRLVDPFAQQVFSLDVRDVNTFQIGQAGNYYLLIEGQSDDSAEQGIVSFNVHRVIPTKTSLNLGDIVNGSLGVGASKRYEFTLGNERLVAFDSRSPLDEVTWTLDGPNGNIQSARPFSSSDADRANSVLHLLSGTYTITVDATGDAAPNYTFRLFDVAEGTAITPGTVADATLTPARSAAAFRFTTTGPQSFYFNARAWKDFSTPPFWRLINPLGAQVFAQSFDDRDTTLLSVPGTYTLLIEGLTRDAAASGHVTFDVHPISNPTNAISLGIPVLGNLGIGEQPAYTFHLQQRTVVYFDSLSSRSDLNWTLLGPTGPVSQTRRFDFSDASRGPDNLLRLIEGDYTVVIDGVGNATGPYGFSLLDISTGTPITLNSVVTGVASPARSTTLYRFPSKVGDYVRLDQRQQSGFTTTPFWRIKDSEGQSIFGGPFQDVNSVGPLREGPSTLLIEGEVGDGAAQGNFEFSIVTLSNVPPVSTGTPLVLNAVTSGSLSAAGKKDFYTFTLPGAAVLVFDNLMNNGGLAITVEGPSGKVFNLLRFNNDDQVVPVPAGDYLVTISGPEGATGNYQFRLTTSTFAAAIPFDLSITNSTSPGASSKLYAFTITSSNKRLYLDWLGFSGYSGTPRLSLFDDTGSVLYSGFGRDFESPAAFAVGHYYLMIGGNIGDTAPSGTHQFNLHGYNETALPLALGDLIQSRINQPGQRNLYHFVLSQRTLVCFDSLTNSSAITWSLDSAAGQWVDRRGLSQGDLTQELPAGEYTLTLDANDDSVGDYSYRLLDARAGSVIALNTPVTVVNLPARGNTFVQFSGTAGQTLFYDSLGVSGNSSNPSLRIYDPENFLLINDSANNEIGPFVLPRSGNYILSVEGQIYDFSAQGTNRFRLVSLSPTSAPLVLGKRIQGAIALPGQIDVYTFTLTESARLLFDGLTNAFQLRWALDGPTGRLINFTPLSGDEPWILATPGDYRLTLKADRDLTLPYDFRILDAQSAAPISLNVPLHLTNDFARGNALYRFVATAGDTLYFDYDSHPGFSSAPIWQVWDADGNKLFDRYFSDDQGPFAAPITGDYLMLIGGGIGEALTPATANLTIYNVSNHLAGISLGQTIDQAFAVPGETDTFTLQLDPSSLYLFDALTSRSGVSWNLESPYGFILQNATIGRDRLFAVPVSGEYRISIHADTGQSGNFAFRVLRLADGQLISLDQVVHAIQKPGVGASVFRFPSEVGDRIYFDFLNRSNYTLSPNWMAVGPYQSTIFSDRLDQDQGPYSISSGGEYYLVVQGAQGETSATGSFDFRVARSPIQPPLNLLQPQTSPDLEVRDLQVSGMPSIHAGSDVQIQYSILNTGNGATTGSWVDALAIRKAGGGPVVVSTTQIYQESDAGNGPILPGSSRSRHGVLHLPEGLAGAGALEVLISADSANAISEINSSGTGEANNSAVLAFQSALPPYPDLRVTHIEISPQPGWTSGIPLTVTWVVTNAGTSTTHGNWTDHVLFRNVSTASVISNAFVLFDSSLPENGNLPPGEVHQSKLQLKFPGAQSLYGLFEVTITVDSADDVFEYIAGEDASANNSLTFQVPSAPDLSVEGLKVTTPGFSGSEVVVDYQIKNAGNVPLTVPIRDRLQMRNRTTGESLSDQFSYYDPLSLDGGVIGIGSSRARQFRLHLPDGPRGTGSIEISVTTDASDGIPEFQGLTPAEGNNSSTNGFVSMLAGYPDLTVLELTVTPTPLKSGKDVLIQWKDANRGSAPSQGSWSDRIQVVNVDRAKTLLDTSFPYPLAQLGPIPNGQSRVRQFSFRLPEGDLGQGLLRFTVTVDGFGNLFEYATGLDAENNNTTNLELPSTLSVYPDLIVGALNVLTSSITSGSEIVVQWVDTNAGNASITGDFSDRLRIRNTTTAQVLLEAGLYLNPSQDPEGPIAPGATRTRSRTFKLPDGSAGSGDLEITVSADDGNRVFEFSVDHDAEANNTATIHRTSNLAKSPDLEVLSISAPTTGVAGQSISLAWTLRNNGAADAQGPWIDQVFLSTDTLPGGDQNLGNFNLPILLPAGQSITTTQIVTLPSFVSGALHFLVKANAGRAFFESNFDNNLFVDPHEILVQTPLLVQLSSSSVSENSGSNAVQWRVTRPAGLSSALEISLSASPPDALMLPSAVTLSAGQASITVPITVIDNSDVDGVRSVTLTAHAAGYSDGQSTLQILDNDRPHLTLQLTPATVQEGDGPNAVIGYLTRNASIASALEVQLSSTATDKIVPPATVTFAAGSRVATFNAASIHNSLLEGNQVVTLTASAPGFGPATESVTVIDSDVPNFTLSLSAPAVSEGAASPAAQGQIARVPVSQTSLTFRLSAEPSTDILLPPTLTLPAGESTVTFPISVTDDNLVNGTRSTLIIARLVSGLGGLLTNSASQPLQIYDNDGPSLSLTLSHDVVTEKGEITGRVQRNTSLAAPLVVQITSSDLNEAQVPTSVTIPVGQLFAEFPIKGVQDGVQDGVKSTLITVSAGGYNSANARLNVIDINLPDLVVGNIIVPSSGQTDSRANVTWSVSNKGEGPARGVWVDRVFISQDDQLGGDTLATFVPANGPFEVGDTYTRTRSIQLPSQPGKYHIIVITDGDNVVTEGSERNNVVSVATIDVQPAYRATLSASIHQAPCGTAIPMTGRVFNVDDNSPVPFRTVSIRIRVGDFRRVFQAQSDANGQFSFVFQPLSTEAGVYSITADHPLVVEDTPQDQFTLLGFRFNPEQLRFLLVPNQPATGDVTIQNGSDQPLTGLSATSPGAPDGLNVQLGLPSTLPAKGSISLHYEITPTLTNQGTYTFNLQVSTAENVVKSLPVTVTLRSLRPQLVATPGSLLRGMLRGTQSIVSFTLENVGGAPTGPLQVFLPQIPWMNLVTAPTIPSIAPGEKTQVSLSLNPPADLPLIRYDGSLEIANSTGGVAVDFQFRALSEAKGDLSVSVTDEFTYFASGSPKVTNALVRLRDGITGVILQEMRSDTNGVALFQNIQEGPYTVDVTADKHSAYRGTAIVTPGSTAELEAFLSRQTVTYRWTVVPIEIVDEYRIKLESVFETEVPIPNLVIEEPFMMPLVVAGLTNQFEIRVRNEGLIAANGVQLRIPDSPDYIITPLVDQIGVIPAKSALSIPVTIRARTSASPSPELALAEADSPVRLAGASDCELQVHACLPKIPLGVTYYYVCGPNNVLQVRQMDLSPICIGKQAYDCYKSVKGAGEKTVEAGGNLAAAACEVIEALLTCAGADLSECQTAALQIACRTVVGAAAGPGGALAGAASGIKDSLGCLCDVLTEWLPSIIDYFGIGGGGGQGGHGSTGGGGFNIGTFAEGGRVYFVPREVEGTTYNGKDCRTPRAGPAPADVSSPGVCARVRIQIEQRATMTRAAFRGSLEIDNAGDAKLTGLRVTLDFQDDQGNSASDKFVVHGPEVSGLGSVDGSGSVPAQGSGTATYLFIPTREAAPTSPRGYHIGGTIEYVENGQSVSLPILSETITVYPEARLVLQYFQSRNVYSDDPFTDAIEPAEPFYLGLIAKNEGAGAAKNLRITSAQPKIVENEKGLLIHFQIIGSRVGDNELSPSLMVDLGTIPPGGSSVAEWVLLSSLQGKFIEYSATFEHIDTLGITNQSLIDHVEIHELIRPVLADRAGDDKQPDFLVNDIPDKDNLPDTLYFSEGLIAPVDQATDGKTDATISLQNLQTILSATQPPGWSYLELPDPGPDFKLWSVKRSDGKPIKVGDNVWTTDRTFPSSIAGAVREHRLHLLDFNGTGRYTLTYRPNDSIPPTLSQIIPVLPALQTTAVDSIEIVMSEDIDLTTLDASDVQLRLNGQNPIPLNQLNFVALPGSHYRISGLQPFTGSDGNYSLQFDASGVQDLAGNSGQGKMAVEWAKGVQAPVVLKIGPVDPSVRNLPVASVEVLFSRPMDPATFDWQSLSLINSNQPGSNLIDSRVAITPVASDRFLIEKLDTLQVQDGEYSLIIRATAVRDLNGVSGVGVSMAHWTLLTTGPHFVALEQLADNPRNIVVASLDVSFSAPIDPNTFNSEDISLTRDDGQNLITSAVTVTAVDALTYRIANFNWVVGQQGVYRMTVQGSGIRDLAGNPVLGSVSESWVMDTGKPASATRLRVEPDLGSSSSDGLINTLTPDLKGTLSEKNLTVRVFDLTSQRDLGQITSPGTEFTLPLDLQTPGAHRLRIRTADAAANLSDTSFVDLFVDLTRPTAQIAAVTPNPLDAALDVLEVEFSEPVNEKSLQTSDLLLKRNGTTNPVSSTVAWFSLTPTRYQIRGLGGSTAKPGLYELSILMSGVEDAAGNAGDTDALVQWSRKGPNTAPTLTPIPNWVLAVGQSIVFTNNATDAELATQTLSYSLASGSPPNMHLDAATGVFSWRPTRNQAPGNYSVTVTVTDDGVPPLSDSRTFTIEVSDFAEVAVGQTAVIPGDTGRVALSLQSTAGITNLFFDLEIPHQLLSDLELLDTSSVVGAASWTSLNADQIRVRIGSQLGQAIRGSNLLAFLSFKSTANQASQFVPIPVGELQTTLPDGNAVPAVFGVPGRVAFVGERPLLEALIDSSGERFLRVFAQPGPTYRLQKAIHVGSSMSWELEREWIPMQLMEEIRPIDASPSALFYEVVVSTPAEDGSTLELRSRADGRFDLLIRGVSGNAYQILESPTLGSNASWTVTRRITLSGPQVLLETFSPSNASRFIRAVSE